MGGSSESDESESEKVSEKTQKSKPKFSKQTWEKQVSINIFFGQRNTIFWSNNIMIGWGDPVIGTLWLIDD